MKQILITIAAGSLLAVFAVAQPTPVPNRNLLTYVLTNNPPCGPNSAVTLGHLAGKYYALDFSQNLYSVDPATGATKLIGPTGMPPITIVPGSIDRASGKLNLYFESLFSFRGKL